MEAQQIVVNIKGMVNLRLEQLNEFQDDIKVLTDERYASFKEEVLADGFDFSPHVWQDSNERFWLLDGHQRKTLLTRMKKEGFHIPTIPCVEVQAESLEHARRMVLAGTSQYGTFQPKKLTAFMKLTGLNGEQMLKRFHIPEVQLKKLVPVAGHLRTIGTEVVTEFPDLAAGEKTSLAQMNFTMTDAQRELVQEALSRAKQLGLAVGDTGNENSNGNALAAICDEFLRSHGRITEAPNAG